MRMDIIIVHIATSFFSHKYHLTMHLHAQSTCIHTGSKCLLIDTNQEASRHMAYMFIHFSLVKGTGSIEKLIQALQIYLKVAILFRA